jgi:mono/diheme cytochrome c family protein
VNRPLVLALALVGAVGAVVALVAYLPGSPKRPDLNDPARIAAGAPLYARQCASCHGANLEGQPNWKTPLASGRMPAPPHDDSGHTWHHASEVLFALTKFGLKPPYGPADYQSDMPAFGATLSDEEIWNVLAFIRSRWSPPVRAKHSEMDRAH